MYEPQPPRQLGIWKNDVSALWMSTLTARGWRWQLVWEIGRDPRTATLSDGIRTGVTRNWGEQRPPPKRIRMHPVVIKATVCHYPTE